MDPQPFINMFNSKTRVTFIHALTGKVIGVHKMKPDQLPRSFTKPTSIYVEGAEWRVMRAEPIHAKDFKLDNKLTLHVQEPSSIDPAIVGSNYPTVSNNIPELTVEPLFTDFILDLTKEQWRQLEFFHISFLPIIQEEMLKIEPILSPGEGVNTLIGYKNVHVRAIEMKQRLAVFLHEFCDRIHVQKKGSIRFTEEGYVKNGIALFSGNYTYYATINSETIEELYLESFDCVDEEFCEIVSSYELLLADWCNTKIIMI